MGSHSLLLITWLGDYLIIRFFDHHFPGGSDSKESACNVGDPDLIPGSGRSPGRREWLPIPVLLPGEFHGQRSLVGYNLRGRKESDITEWVTVSPVSYLQGKHLLPMEKNPDSRVTLLNTQRWKWRMEIWLCHLCPSVFTEVRIAHLQMWWLYEVTIQSLVCSLCYHHLSCTKAMSSIYHSVVLKLISLSLQWSLSLWIIKWGSLLQLCGHKATSLQSPRHF